MLKFSLITHKFTLSCNSWICDVSSCIVAWLSLNSSSENSWTRISWAFFNSSTSWIFRILVSRSVFLVAPILREVGPALFEILHTDNLRYPVPSDENACRWNSRMQVLRASTLHSCFKISDFASASMWSLLPSRRDFATFTVLENLKKGSQCPRNCWCLKKKRFLIQPIFA